jgi:hypothetical protein
MFTSIHFDDVSTNVHMCTDTNNNVTESNKYNTQTINHHKNTTQSDLKERMDSSTENAGNNSTQWNQEDMKTTKDNRITTVGNNTSDYTENPRVGNNTTQLTENTTIIENL